MDSYQTSLLQQLLAKKNEIALRETDLRQLRKEYRDMEKQYNMVLSKNILEQPQLPVLCDRHLQNGSNYRETRDRSRSPRSSYERNPTMSVNMTFDIGGNSGQQRSRQSRSSFCEEHDQRRFIYVSDSAKTTGIQLKQRIQSKFSFKNDEIACLELNSSKGWRLYSVFKVLVPNSKYDEVIKFCNNMSQVSRARPWKQM